MIPVLPSTDFIRLDHPQFVPFLRFLYYHRDYATEDLLEIVSRPWRWQEEFKEFLATGGKP